MNVITTYSRAMLVATTLLSLGACAASGTRPDVELARAQTSIDLAEESGAREFGLTALEHARNHLAEAQRAADDREYETALRLAHEAELDAELAAAQTDHQKSELALAEIKESIATLRREIARNERNEGEPS